MNSRTLIWLTKNCNTKCYLCYSTSTKPFKNKHSTPIHKKKEIQPFVTSDRRIIFNSLLATKKYQLSKLKKTGVLKNKEISEEASILRMENILPAFLSKNLIKKKEKILDDDKENKTSGRTYPYSKFEKVEKLKENEEISPLKEPIIDWNPPEITIKDDIKLRMEKYEKGTLESRVHFNPRDLNNEKKGFDYLMQHLDREATVQNLLTSDSSPYGTPNPNYPVSEVPCGGCGAELHCQDTALPGYIPSQRFVGLTKRQLAATLCQRCHYLKHYNMALNVRVSSEDYISSLTPLKKDRALVLVIVDLLDMPCSIWPGLIEVLGTRRPVIIVGNKVDLLPPDGPGHLDNVMEVFKTTVDNSDLGQCNIVDAALISAATGFGIEELLDKIHNQWGHKGNLYIVGCTNAGKSTLFNALLGSDLCQSSAIDLVMRATTSPWPGTTLNMLKFPMLTPTGLRLKNRNKRLNQINKLGTHLEHSLPQDVNFTKDINIATLSGYIGHSYTIPEQHIETEDPFSIKADKVPSRIALPNKGVDPDSYQYVKARWCFDTPGAISEEQFFNHLTHNEAVMLSSKSMVVPRSYLLKTRQSLLIGGCARIDLLYTDDKPICVTIFTSEALPISIINTVDASAFYRDYLGKDLLGVPSGDQERLNKWPHLKPRNISTVGIGQELCSSDITLSSAGWFSVSGKLRQIIDLRCWTPNGVGIHIREKSILPRTVNLKGMIDKKTQTFGQHVVYIPDIKMRQLQWVDLKY